ncbi:MAG: signal peptidase I [Olsenella sp.]|nr:signal peptidase I [Olsenella sp.]
MSAAQGRPRPQETVGSERNQGVSQVQLPTVDQIDEELQRTEGLRHRHGFRRNVMFALVGVFAVSVLLSTFVLPTFRIYGQSMSPTLNEGDIVVATKSASYNRGDLVAFSYNNKVLAKRVIGCPGDWVDIDANGNVSINGETIDEPYLQAGAKSLGQCDISLPYQVPEDTYFVMGDKRSVSVDSRLTQVGCIPQDQIVGKLALRVWPLGSFGAVGSL